MKFTQAGNQVVIKDSEPLKIFMGLIAILIGSFIAFVPGSEPSGHTLVLIAGGVFAALGLAIMLDARTTKTVLQKGGPCTIRVTPMILRNSQEQTFQPSDVASVRTIKDQNSIYWVYLHMQKSSDDDDIELAASRSGKKIKAAAEAVRSVLSTVHEDADMRKFWK